MSSMKLYKPNYSYGATKSNYSKSHEEEYVSQSNYVDNSWAGKPGYNSTNYLAHAQCAQPSPMINVVQNTNGLDGWAKKPNYMPGPAQGGQHGQGWAGKPTQNVALGLGNEYGMIGNQRGIVLHEEVHEEEHVIEKVETKLVNKPTQYSGPNRDNRYGQSSSMYKERELDAYDYSEGGVENAWTNKPNKYLGRTESTQGMSKDHQGWTNSEFSGPKSSLGPGPNSPTNLLAPIKTNNSGLKMYKDQHIMGQSDHVVVSPPTQLPGPIQGNQYGGWANQPIKNSGMNQMGYSGNMYKGQGEHGFGGSQANHASQDGYGPAQANYSNHGVAQKGFGSGQADHGVGHNGFGSGQGNHGVGHNGFGSGQANHSAYGVNNNGLGSPQAHGATQNGFGLGQANHSAYGVTNNGFGSPQAHGATQNGFGSAQANHSAYGATQNGFGSAQANHSAYGSNQNGFASAQAKHSAHGATHNGLGSAHANQSAYGATQNGFGSGQANHSAHGATQNGFGLAQPNQSGYGATPKGFGSGQASNSVQAAYRYHDHEEADEDVHELMDEILAKYPAHNVSGGKANAYVGQNQGASYGRQQSSSNKFEMKNEVNGGGYMGNMKKEFSRSSSSNMFEANAAGGLSIDNCHF